MKKKRILIILLILLIIVTTICVYLKYLKVNFKLNNNDVEINSDVLVSSFIKEGNLSSDDYLIDTSTLGNKEITVEIDNKEYTINYKVVDTTKPVIDGDDEISIFLSETESIDFNEYFKVTDNSNEDIKVNISGDYKLEVGTYNLTCNATDSSNNKASKEFTLNVFKDKNNYTFTTSKGFKGEVIDGVTYIDGTLIVNKTYSLPSTFGNGLTKETTDAFYKMQKDAWAQGLNIYISSGFRTYMDQYITYNNYVKRDGSKASADRYSARAGNSEHQSGLTFDLNTINAAFADTNEGKWVNDNCYKYGFIIRYPNGKDDITGYKYESWHLRYVGVDLATILYNDGDWITLEEYYGITSSYEEEA